MKVVVTGSAGLLGRYVSAACVEAGYDVTGVDRVRQQTPQWAHMVADLADSGAAVQLFAGADAVIHCAAIPRPTGVAAAEVYRVNMATAYAALEGARRCDVPLFIYASSFSVLGYPFAPVLPTPVFLPIDETHPVGPQDIYATTKWLGEELVESFVRQNAFRAVSLRMPWVQTPESFAREVGPRRRTRDAAADLWAYIDARDAGFGFVQALGWRGPGHLRCFLSAADTYSEQPTRELVSEFYGNGPKLRRPLDGHASLIDTALAKEELRFVARHTWRDYPLSGA